MKELRRRCRELLPDAPRWVGTRDLLAREDSSIVGSDDGRSFVVWSEEGRLGSVVGHPDRTAVIEAAAACPELLAFPENGPWVRRTLDGFHAEPATILAAPARPPISSAYRCHPLARAEVLALQHAREGLREELLHVVDDGATVVAAFDGSLPVAFAYVAAQTESLWDVSIDTVSSHRRKGYAQAAVLTLMEIMQGRGKTAVWGAAQSNPASLNLARKLAFIEVDELWLLTRPASTESEWA